MKKVVLLAGCLSLLAVGIIGVSCSKDKKEWKGCACRIVEDDGNEILDQLSASEVRTEWAVDNCDRLATMIRREWGSDAKSVNCTDL